MLNADQIAAMIAPSFGRNIQDKTKAMIAAVAGLNTVPVKIDGREEIYNAVYNALRIAPGELVVGLPVELFVNDQGIYELYGSYGEGVRQAYPGDAPPPAGTFEQHNHTDFLNGGPLGAGAVSATEMLADGVVTDAKIASVAANKITAPGVIQHGQGGLGADLSASSNGRIYKSGSGAFTYKDNSASSNPTASDDDSSDYSVGSNWFNTSTNEFWKCTSNTPGAAVWKRQTSLLEVTTRTANTFFAGPVSGSAAAGFRAIDPADILFALRRWHSTATEVALPNSTTETTLDTPTAFSASFFTVGKIWDFVSEGWATNSSGSTTLTLRFKLNGATVITFANITVAAGATSYWKMHIRIGCRALGSSDTLWVHGSLEHNNQQIDVQGQTTSTTALDINTSATITPTTTGQFGASIGTRAGARNLASSHIINP